MVVPDICLSWNYHENDDCQSRDLLISCLLSRLKGTVLKPISFQKILEVVQNKYENSPQFLQNLRQAPKYEPRPKDPEWPTSPYDLLTL